ncbi:hypothetical protein [Symbiopectobacterium purcellii]|nr:hypothetical protein [Symbiopectobacterium purcellii]
MSTATRTKRRYTMEYAPQNGEPTRRPPSTLKVTGWLNWDF